MSRLEGKEGARRKGQNKAAKERDSGDGEEKGNCESSVESLFLSSKS